MNVFGMLKEAQIEVLASDPSSPQKARIWFNKTSNDLKVYDNGVTRVLVNLDQTQTLTNKDIDAANNTLSNITDSEISASAAIALSKLAALTANRATKTDGSGVIVPSTVTDTELERLAGITSTAVGISDAQVLTNKTIDDSLTIKEVAEPSSPASGYQALYFDTADNKPKRKTSTGEVLDLGGGAGGGFNLEADGFAQLSEDGSTGNWIGYDDAAAAPVDLTGGTFDTTFANSATDTTILSGDYAGNFLWTLDAVDRQGEGVAKAFTIPPALRGKAIYISGRYTTDVATANGDFGLYAYDVTNTALMNIRGLDGSNNLGGLSAGAIGKFTAVIYTASDTASVRLGFHRKVTDATATEFRFSDLRVTDSAIVDAPIVSDWVEFTPTISGVSGTSTGSYRRIGDSIEVSGTIVTSAAPIGLITAELPSGLSFDFSKMTAPDNYNVLGDANVQQTGVGVDHTGNVLTLNGTTNQVFFVGPEDGSWGTTYPFILAASPAAYLRYNYSVPILEWANSSAVLSTSEMLNKNIRFRAYMSSTSTQTANNNSQIVPWDDVTFDDLGSFDTSNNNFTAPKKMTAMINAQVTFDANAAGTARSVQVNVDRGAGDVRYSDGATEPRTSIQNTAMVSSIIQLEKGDIVSVKAFQNSGGNLGYREDADESFFELIEIPDLSVYGVYGETEYVESHAAPFSAMAFTANTAVSITSITLSAGTWDLSANVHMRQFAAQAADVYTFISTSASTTPDGTDGKSRALHTFYSGVAADSATSVIDYKDVTVTEDTVFYLKHYSPTTETSGFATLDHYMINARRIK